MTPTSKKIWLFTKTLHVMNVHLPATMIARSEAERQLAVRDGYDLEGEYVAVEPPIKKVTVTRKTLGVSVLVWYKENQGYTENGVVFHPDLIPFLYCTDLNPTTREYTDLVNLRIHPNV